MKRLTIGLLGILLAAFAVPALAQAVDPPAPAADDVALQDTATAQDLAQEPAPATTDQPAASERTCLRYTGSRAQRNARMKNPPCTDEFGRAYTRDEIDKTGEVDLADALRKLDPSIH